MKKYRTTAWLVTCLCMVQLLNPFGVLATASQTTTPQTSAASTSTNANSAPSGTTSSAPVVTSIDISLDIGTSTSSSAQPSNSQPAQTSGEDSPEEVQEQAPDEEETPKNTSEVIQGPKLEMDVISDSIFLADNVTGTILLEKNADVKRYPAGLTKVVTALVVLENGNVNDTVIISENAGTAFGKATGLIDLVPGEEITVSDLLYCMLLAPSNEAALALAEHVSGNDVDLFIDMMNELAQRAGCENTRFVNVTGLDTDNQYTTARDMFRIARYAMSNARFMAIANSQHKQTYSKQPSSSGVMQEKERYFSNDNRLISQIREIGYYYSAAEGIMSGYTAKAGYCLMTTGKKSSNGMNLVCIVMGGKLYTQGGNSTTGSGGTEKISSYVDAKNVMVAAFEQFQLKSISMAGEVIDEVPVKASTSKDAVTIGTQSNVQIVLPIDVKDSEVVRNIDKVKEVKAPVKTGDVLGTMTITYNDETYGPYTLIALSDIPGNFVASVLYDIECFFRSTIVQICIILLIILGVFYIRVTIQANQKRQEEIRRNQMRKSQKRY